MESTRTIICIAGPTASGKTTLAETFAFQYSAYRVRGSELLAEIAKERGFLFDKTTLQNLYLSEREVYGEDFLANRVAKKAIDAKTEIAIIEGMRRATDIHSIERATLGTQILLQFIYTDASPLVRFTRYNLRQQQWGVARIDHVEFKKLEENGAEDELMTVREMISERGQVLCTDNLSKDEMCTQAKQALGLM